MNRSSAPTSNTEVGLSDCLLSLVSRAAIRSFLESGWFIVEVGICLRGWFIVVLTDSY